MNDIVDTIDLKEFLLNAHPAFLSRLNGKNSPAIKERREKALSEFAQSGFPTTANEEWKYTNLSNILKKEFSFQATSQVSKEDVEKFLLPDFKSNVVVFVNGKLDMKLSTLLDGEEVLQVKELSEAAAEDLEKYFKGSAAHVDAFSSLNFAFAEAGAFLKVKKGKTLLYPIAVYFITDRRQQSVFTQPRLILLAEEQSSSKIVEFHVTMGEHESFANAHTDVFLELDSDIDYYKIQTEGEQAYHVGTTQVDHQAKSKFTATTITVSGALVRNNINIAMNASYSECYLNGLYLIDEKRHVDNHSLVDHATANCYSNELYKGVLSGKSVGVFNGKIMVREDAQKTNAFQSNKNVLLSQDATMNTKPQLEIFADDVKCSHGATVGQLNEEPLFYLRSRGLSEKMAKALLTLAFAEDIIEKIQISGLKDVLKITIAENLSK